MYYLEQFKFKKDHEYTDNILSKHKLYIEDRAWEREEYVRLVG